MRTSIMQYLKSLFGRGRVRWACLALLASLLPSCRSAVDVAYDEGMEHCKQGRLEEAAAAFTRAIELEPSDPYLLFARGQVYYAQGKFDDAIGDYTRVITDLDPQNAEGLRYEALCNRGWAYSEKRELDRALADLDEAVKTDGSNLEALLARGLVHYNQGEQDDLRKAIDDYTKVIERDPNNADGLRSEALYNRGCAHFKNGDMGKALADLDEAVRSDDNDVEALLARGRVYHNLQNWRKAIDDFNTVLVKEQGNAGALRGRAAPASRRPIRKRTAPI